MKRIIPVCLFIILFINSTGISRTQNALKDPVLQENMDNLVLVEGFKTKGKNFLYKIGKYEVTQELYQAVMGTNPSYYHANPPRGENQNRRPVEFVSWYDAVYFCNQLTTLVFGKKECCYTITNIIYKTDDDEAAKEKAIKETPTYVTFIKSADVKINHNKKGFRLPTREEWLFAAQGGLQSKGYKFSGSDKIEEIAWYFSNSGKMPHEVGLLKPNELDLYDMTGNVNEFCEDLTWYTNTRNEKFPRRIICGGSFYSKEELSLLSYKDGGLESPGNGGQGFRIVCAAK